MGGFNLPGSGLVPYYPRSPTMRRDEDELRDILRRRTRDDAEMRPQRMVGRNTDGTVNWRRLDGECIERGDVCSAYDGQVVELPCAPPFRSMGASGIPARRIGRRSAVLWLESLDPSLLMPGESYTIELTGKGFLDTFDIDFLVPGSPGTRTLNPYILKLDVRVTDGEHAEVDVEVLAGAPPIDLGRGRVAYENVGSPL